MPVNIDNIKDAFSKFEDDDFVSAKEILAKEISDARDGYLRDKLGLSSSADAEEVESNTEDEVDEACGGKKKKKKVM
jgi:hypothetical protein